MEERCLTSCKLNALTRKVESCGFLPVEEECNHEGAIIKSALTYINRSSSAVSF
jgi:hypothetical protein